MKPVPRLEPYLITYIPHYTPYVPWLSIYRPLKGQTIAVAVTNTYIDRYRKKIYRLIFEKDTEMEWEKYFILLQKCLYPHVRMVVRTEHGYHVYTNITSYNPKVILRKMRELYYYGLVDEGQLKLSEKRVEEGKYHNGFIMLRVAGKYLYNDLRIIYEEGWKDQWLRKVKKLLQAFI